MDDIKADSVKRRGEPGTLNACAFVYDEALGIPAEAIPAGTRWEDVPETWSCPDCSASKSDFAMLKL